MRIIQYLGSKLNIRQEISQLISSIADKNSTIVDAFAGTGVVGNELKLQYHIIANDIQKYSYVINSVLLSSSIYQIAKGLNLKELILESKYFQYNRDALLNIFHIQIDKEKEIIYNADLKLLADFTSSQLFYNGTNYQPGLCLEFDKTYQNVLDQFSDNNISMLRSNNKIYMLFSLYYLNGYFSLYQCIIIDSIKFAINNIDDKLVKTYLLFLLLHAVSEVTCGIGKQFAQPIKLKDKDLNIKEAAAKRCLKDWQLDVFLKMEYMHKKILDNLEQSMYNNTVLNLEINDLLALLNNRNDLIYYLDPPYTIDHYSRFYHVLEVLVTYDYPNLEKRHIHDKDVILNGRYPINRFQSPLSIPSKAYEQFDSIFKSISSSKSKLVLSYSDARANGRSRVLDKKDIIELLEKYFNNIVIYEITHEYRKFNKYELNNTGKDTRELIFVGENNG